MAPITAPLKPPEDGILPDPPLVGRSDWNVRYPWLIQGVTCRSEGRGDGKGRSFDLRLWGPSPGEEVLPRWERLRTGLGVGTVVRSRQVHGTGIRVARAGSPGLLLAPPADGHLTRDAGVLLTVSVADCVPVFLVEPASRTLGLLHAGWRGAAAGIVEAGVAAMWERFGVEPEELHLHLGPAIGGQAYEVGPEVFAALGLPEPAAPALLDLRAHLADRAREAGVPPRQIGISEICVKEDPRFFSHRGGDAGRQVAVLGWRTEDG